VRLVSLSLLSFFSFSALAQLPPGKVGNWIDVTPGVKTIVENGNELPIFARAYRWNGNQIEIRPKEDPRGIIEVELEYAKAFAEETKAWKKRWIYDWYNGLLAQFKTFNSDVEAELTKEPNRAVRIAAGNRYLPIKKKVTATLSAFHDPLAQERDLRDDFRKGKMWPKIEGLRQEDWPVTRARTVFSELWAVENARRSTVETKLMLEWDGDPKDPKSKGVGTEWNAFVIKDVLAQERERFKPYEAVRTQLKARWNDGLATLNAQHLAWVETEHSKVREWELFSETRLAGDPTKPETERGGEPLPHIRTPIYNDYSTEKAKRETFFAEAKKSADLIRSIHAASQNRADAIIEDAFLAGTPADAVRSNIDKIWETDSPEWTALGEALHNKWIGDMGEAKREAAYPSVDAAIAAARAQYPIRRTYENSPFMEERALRDNQDHLVFLEWPEIHDAIQKQALKQREVTPLIKMEGRRSFTTHQNYGLLVADRISAEKAEIAPEVAESLRAYGDKGAAALFLDRRLLAVMPVPLDGARFDQVTYDENLHGFVLTMKDPNGDPLSLARVLDPVTLESRPIEK
jgi:hypothetical protein